MGKMNMKVTTEVTDETGKITVKDILELGQMKLVDVVKMQRKLLSAVDSRLNEQEHALMANPE